MKPILAALAAISLAACATEPTRYQPAAGARAVGYSELRIEPDRYRVTFQGGAGASTAQVEDFALLRAADLAIAGGYDWFRVTDRFIRQTGYGGSSLSLGVGGASFGRRTATGVGVGSSFPLGGGPALSATLEILMGRGPRPPGLDAYDARSVRASVGRRAF